MKKIVAKFTRKCAETGKQIRKGEEMYYDYYTDKCYHLTSTTVKRWEQYLEAERALQNHVLPMLQSLVRSSQLF